MSVPRHAAPSFSRVLITRLVLCVLLLGQLAPARLIPHAWTDEARWAAMGLCTSHGETDGQNSHRTHPEECCSLPCCHPAPAPLGVVLAARTLRQEQFVHLWPPQRLPPPAPVAYRTPPSRAPPAFGLT